MEYVLNTLEKSISGAINEVNTNVNTEITDRKALIDRTAETNTVTVGDAEDTLNLLSNGKLQNNGQEMALMSDVEDILEPYTVNLTNLLSAQDSESISTAIGGIDNLNATVTKNQVIFGTLANGTVAVGIRVLGNQTTLTYFVDSLVGLTVNEVIITNTSGTLSKTVNTHSVLTENMVINSLTSDETTLPLSAAQGKALANSKADSQDITDAINALNKAEVSAGTGEVISSVSQENGIVNASKRSLTSDDIPTLPQSKIEDLTDTLAGKQDTLVFNTPYGASTNKAATMQDVTNNINSIIPEGTKHPQSFILTNVGNDSGTFPLSFKELTGSNRTESNLLLGTGISFSYDIDNPGPYIYVEGITDSILKEDTILTNDKTIVGAINELKTTLQDKLTAGTGIEITPENQINVTLDTNVFFVAETVPESPSEDQKKKICLVPADTTEEGNFYTEYVWVIDDTHPDGYWEEFGTYTSEVDLTDYLKSVDAANTYLSKTDAASTYATQTALDAKQNSVDDTLETTSKNIVGAINEVRETLNSNKAYIINLTPIMSQAGSIVSKDVVDWDNLVTAVQNRVPIQVTQIMEGISDVMLYDLQALLYQSSDIPTVLFRFDGNGTDYSVILQLQSDSTNVQITVEEKKLRLDVTTLFADTASITSRLSSQIAAYGESSATDFPLMYAGASIGNIKPTWIRTSAGITNFMCIADNKIWYFEIEGTTVQRASLAIS